MKRNLSFAVVMLTVMLLLLSGPAFALPTLQLDIVGDGVYYDDVTETIIAPSGVFSLYALLNNKNDADLFWDRYYLSAAVVPKTDAELDLGSFTINGETIHVTDDMEYGAPPIAGHGIFDTYFAEIDFNFEAGNTVGAYNTQDNPGGFGSVAEGNSLLYYAEFVIDTTGLSPDYAIHFDLYNGDGSEFAPFSHDAQSGDVPAPVPEPATLLLFGTGLFGVVGVTRRKNFKKSNFA